MTTAQLTRDVAASSMALLVRRVSVLATTAVSTAVIARAVTAADYGTLQSSLAAWTVALSICEFGFGAVLSREIARRSQDHSSLLRMGLELQGVLGVAVAGVFAAVAVVVGSSSAQGLMLLVLAPSLAVAGFSGGRSYFLATFQTRRLVRIDVIVAAAQLAAVIAVALSTHSAIAIAAVSSAAVVLNTVWVGLAARRAAGRSARYVAGWPTFLRQVVPLGISSVISRVYVSADLIILAAIATESEVAWYAGATKIYAFLNTMTALVVAAALPGLASLIDDREAVMRLTRRIFSWIATTVLPAFVLCAVFAPTACEVVLGPNFRQASGLLVILSATGIVSTFGQIFGTLLTASGVVRPMLYQNIAGAVLNIGANVVLVPHYGARACAVVTLLTEVLVCAGSFWTLKRRLSITRQLRVVVRPAAVTAVAAVAALLLAEIPWLGVPVASLTLLLGFRLFACWPEEFPLQRLFRRRAQMSTTGP
ncbi:polysaccharide biosynthesis C-terminal domain-containing protein [Dactylosporangium vinaceum]|uniref:Polysaccharide biosynthesis C-terminal domain-containing protein n=1 Tax=Dactylosporangium vinaceum TaxID=53362 RepID=A0ABV5MIG6_9ACTN|nr:polysaccharide biosynthesis C-terminal domain-containing protein [Dactylosporangium vinaceum]UAB97604.1 polysaccharide biosynthesis C-terminal domain-containing protein [Dactylosporangium vinaceum]